jgi:ornithine--oxo-acid transaminase
MLQTSRLQNNLGYSQTPDQIIFELEERYGAHHYERLPVVIRQAEGSWLTDIHGNKYLDCLAAYSAANPGHNHPKIVQALVAALNGGYGSVISNVVYTDPLGLFLNRAAHFIPQLGTRFGSNGNKVLPKNGGVESVETALKTARFYGWKVKGIPDGKQEIIVFDNNFHGRMTTVISFSSKTLYREGFGPLTPGFISVPFGDATAVERAITPNTCGILVEPFQGEGGMNIPHVGFLKALREVADKHFCFEHEGVVPDGLILGKALSGGLVPLSLFATNAAVMDLVFKRGSDGSTYGGYPLACVAGLAAFDLFEAERFDERSALQGAKLILRLQDIASKSDKVKEVRGKGLFIGIEVRQGEAMKFCRELLGQGLLVNDSHGHTIRISPPLIIDDVELDFLCERIEKVLAK